MNQLQALLILSGMWLFVISIFIFVIYWFKKNNILIQVTEFKNNVIVYSSIRCRIKGNELYSFKDFLGKKEIGINKDMYKDFLIKSEGLPVFGTNLILNVKRHKGKYFPYIIYLNENEQNVLVDDNMVAWVNEARNDLYKATELKISTQDQVIKFIVPIGIILLAISCLIFFPKMYEVVMETGNAAAKSAISDFTGTLTKFIPKG